MRETGERLKKGLVRTMTVAEFDAQLASQPKVDEPQTTCAAPADVAPQAAPDAPPSPAAAMGRDTTIEGEKAPKVIPAVQSSTHQPGPSWESVRGQGG
jgi:hypothetical protein